MFALCYWCPRRSSLVLLFLACPAPCVLHGFVGFSRCVCCVCVVSLAVVSQVVVSCLPVIVLGSFSSCLSQSLCTARTRRWVAGAPPHLPQPRLKAIHRCLAGQRKRQRTPSGQCLWAWLLGPAELGQPQPRGATGIYHETRDNGGWLVNGTPCDAGTRGRWPRRCWPTTPSWCPALRSG